MKRILKVLVVLALIGAAAAWFLSAPKPLYAAGDPALDQGGDAGRGKLVFYAGGCASCHMTPGQEDRLKLGGGLELGSPFGSFYAPNISSHPRDGIGNWKAADLANAMLAGVSPKGEHYYPSFPYTSYHLTKFEDVRDLMAYLRTLAPVEGRARDHDLPFPFNIRRTLGLWKLLFFSPQSFAPDAAKSAGWNRGRYLVEGLGHCVECHSPRNLLGGIPSGARFAGGPDPHGKGWNPNLTPHESGLAKWSAKDIAELLGTGFTPDYDSVGAGMASVVKNMAELPAEDRAAMAEYLKSLPPRPSPPKPEKK